MPKPNTRGTGEIFVFKALKLCGAALPHKASVSSSCVKEAVQLAHVGTISAAEEMHALTRGAPVASMPLCTESTGFGCECAGSMNSLWRRPSASGGGSGCMSTTSPSGRLFSNASQVCLLCHQMPAAHIKHMAVPQHSMCWSARAEAVQESKL